jgi:branched-chain amino acid transport system substrate-binding protein
LRTRLNPAGPRVLAVMAAFALALAVGACGSDDESDSASGGGGGDGGASTTAAPTKAKCGAGNGEKASGEAIKIGAIITKQPGVDFTDITKTAKAVFDCVNDNGGINGRPVQYIAEPEQTNPQQVASLATKLFEQEKVLGLAGSSSIIDCDVNHEYYEKNDIYVIAAGIARECYFGSNVRNVNMGPYFSALGAAQYLVRQKVKGLAVAGAKIPGGDFNNLGVTELAKENNLPAKAFQETVPITDGPGTALKLANAAGDGGGVVLVFTAPEALKILQGAEQQGLIDKVKWACATPCNDASISAALGPAWNDKLGINAELNLVDTTGPDTLNYRAVLKQYAPNVAVGSFSQMGYTAATIAAKALMDIKGDVTKKSVNEAFKAIDSYETDILCKPWSWGGEQYLSNYSDRTIVPKDHKFVQKEDCFNIAAVPSNFLGQQYEESGEG